MNTCPVCGKLFPDYAQGAAVDPCMCNAPKRPVGRPPSLDPTSEAWIQLRVTKARKGAYVGAARRLGQTLSAWMFGVCDKAARE